MNPMKLILGGAMSLALLLGTVQTGMTHSCESVCNQARRACRADATVDRKLASRACAVAADECGDTCATDAGACAEACDEGDTACAEACAADAELCQAGCETDLETCQGDAQLARETANGLCGDARAECRAFCDEYDGDGCVRGCARAAGTCFRESRRSAKACIEGCREADQPRACRRDCKAGVADAIDACLAGFDACAVGCVPTTTSTTSTTLP